MKKIQKGSIKHLVLLVFLIVIIEMIIFPLFDLVCFKFLLHTKFVYSVSEYVFKPISLGIVLGLVLWVIDRPKKK